jgi:hypothetical protein
MKQFKKRYKEKGREKSLHQPVPTANAFRVTSLDTHAADSVIEFSLFGVSNFLFYLRDRERETHSMCGIFSSARFALDLVD